MTLGEELALSLLITLGTLALTLIVLWIGHDARRR